MGAYGVDLGMAGFAVLSVLSFFFVMVCIYLQSFVYDISLVFPILNRRQLERNGPSTAAR